MARRPRFASVPTFGDWREHSQHDPNFVTALARGLEVLRAFTPGDGFLGNSELSSRTGIPKPTVSRLTQTLTILGYLRYSNQLEKYQLGAGVLALGYQFMAGTGLRDLARPHMQALADASDCAVAFGSYDRLEMVYVTVCQGAGPLILRLDAGARIPIAETAMGRAYVAGLPPAQRALLVHHLSAADPERWRKARPGLEAALAYYEKHGFCISEGTWNAQVNAVGVPLVLEGGAHVMAFNCGGSALKLTRQVLENNLGPRLLAVAEKVRSGLGGVVPVR